jgi:hypothetical protein
LDKKNHNPSVLRALAEGRAEAMRDVLDGLKRLAALTPPVQAVQKVVNRLRQSAERLATLQGTDAARSPARRGCSSRRWRSMRPTWARRVRCAARQMGWARTWLA